MVLMMEGGFDAMLKNRRVDGFSLMVLAKLL